MVVADFLNEVGAMRCRRGAVLNLGDADNTTAGIQLPGLLQRFGQHHGIRWLAVVLEIGKVLKHQPADWIIEGLGGYSGLHAKRNRLCPINEAAGD